ncbi:unnamed protein product, partial [Symbiodinium sp. CCMP2456]
MDMSPTTKSIMQQTQVEADEKIALEMARELEQLQAEAVKLEQMKILQDLEMEELELQSLLQQQKAVSLHQAAASAGLIVPKDDKVSCAPKGLGVVATAVVNTKATSLENSEVQATAAASPEVQAAAVNPEVRATAAVNPDAVLATTAVNPEVLATKAENPPEVPATAAVNPEVQASVAKVELGAAPASAAIASIDNLETQPMELAPIAATMCDMPSKAEDSAEPLPEPSSGKDGAPSTCPVKRLPAISPADQSKMAGVAPKKRARAKKPQSSDDDGDEGGDSDPSAGACSSGGTGYKGKGGRGRGASKAASSPRKASSKREHEDGETGAPSKKKDGEAKKTEEESKPKKQVPSDEEKKRRSRKSVAYHKAKVTTLREGGCLVAHLALLPKQKAGEFAPTFKVLLIRWMTNMAIEPRFQLFDLFCGQGNLSKYWKEAGYPVASYDKNFGPHMDMNTNSGFVLVLLLMLVLGMHATFLLEQHIDKSGKPRFTGKSQELKQSGIYTLEFAKSLLAVYEAWLARPGMPLSDTWMDSGIHEVVLYLYKSSHL